MDNDDGQMGQVLTRREALALIGTSGLFLLGGGQGLSAPPALAAGGRRVCVVRPQQTEGPYFVDEMLNRSDIRSDPSERTEQAGARLDLSFSVSRVTNGQCAPLAGAHVDVWQCDHLGVYSDVRDPRFDTRGKKFLRGFQVTDTNGIARFTTIYPGWYQGRAVHIHFKIRSAPAVRPGFEFTSQLYFSDDLTDQVHASLPYSAKGQRTVRNDRDGIFRRQGGRDLVLDVALMRDAYTAAFDVALA